MKGVTLPTETVFVMEMSPIKFGLGAMEEVGFDASRLGIRKALIFTDRHLAELGLPERVRALLEEQGVKADVWDGVEVEPTDRSMEEAGEYARSKDCGRADRGRRRQHHRHVQGGQSPHLLPGPVARLHQQAGRQGRAGPGPAQAR